MKMGKLITSMFLMYLKKPDQTLTLKMMLIILTHQNLFQEKGLDLQMNSISWARMR